MTKYSILYTHFNVEKKNADPDLDWVTDSKKNIEYANFDELVIEEQLLEKGYVIHSDEENAYWEFVRENDGTLGAYRVCIWDVDEIERCEKAENYGDEIE